MDKTIYHLHIVRNETKHTKKDAQELTDMLNKGWDVASQFGNNGEYYFVLFKESEEEIEVKIN